MKPAIKSFYGDSFLYRVWCDNCKAYAFVINREIQCCTKIIEMPESFVLERQASDGKMRRGITQKQKLELFLTQKGRCFYCTSTINIDDCQGDHILPWNYIQTNKTNNFVLTCKPCNQVKHDRIFWDMNAARDFILSRRNKKREVSQSNQSSQTVETIKHEFPKTKQSKPLEIKKAKRSKSIKRPIHKPHKELVCPYCKKTFTQTRYGQKYHSPDCRMAYHNLTRRRVWEAYQKHLATIEKEKAEEVE